MLATILFLIDPGVRHDTHKASILIPPIGLNRVGDWFSMRCVWGVWLLLLPPLTSTGMHVFMLLKSLFEIKIAR